MRCKIRWNWKGKFFVFFFFFASGGPISFSPPAGHFCQQRQKYPKTPFKGEGMPYFPSPLKNPPTLKRRKRGGVRASPLSNHPSGGGAIIKSRLLRRGAPQKAGGGWRRRGYGLPRQCAPQGYLLRGERWLGMTALRAGGASGGEKETPSGRMVFLFTAGAATPVGIPLGENSCISGRASWRRRSGRPGPAARRGHTRRRRGQKSWESPGARSYRWWRWCCCSSSGERTGIGRW